MTNKEYELDLKIQRLKKEKSLLEKEMKYAHSRNNRKERARRLIETGALAEKYFEMDHLTLAEREELFKTFSTFINSNKPKKFKKQP